MIAGNSIYIRNWSNKLCCVCLVVVIHTSFFLVKHNQSISNNICLWYIVMFIMICSISMCPSINSWTLFTDQELQRRTTRNRNREEIRLEDFFWTGSGDGKPPPDIWDNAGHRTGISRDQNVIIKTETVVATVYLDGNNVRVFLPFWIILPMGFRTMEYKIPHRKKDKRGAYRLDEFIFTHCIF